MVLFSSIRLIKINSESFIENGSVTLVSRLFEPLNLKSSFYSVNILRILFTVQKKLFSLKKASVYRVDGDNYLSPQALKAGFKKPLNALKTN